MTTTEQAEKASHALRHGRIDEVTMLNGADVIDSLAAELNEEKMRGYQADQALAEMVVENEKLRDAALMVVNTHNHTLPILAAYMSSLGIKKEWEAQCSASDALRAALGETKS